MVHWHIMTFKKKKNCFAALIHCHSQPLRQFLKHSVHAYQTQRTVCILICEIEMKSSGVSLETIGALDHHYDRNSTDNGT